MLDWRAQGGRQYQVEFAPALDTSTGWSNAAAPVLATGGVPPWSNTTASLTLPRPAATTLVYRVRRTLTAP